MARPLRLRPEVVAFAQAMERKLRANDHKGGWEDEDPEWLMDRLKEEVAELDRAITTRDGGPLSGRAMKRVIREASDVANFAMMLAQVCGGMPVEFELDTSKWAEAVERTRVTGFSR